MEASAQLLNYIYETAKMGKDIAAYILKSAKFPNYTEALENQLIEYEKIYHEARSKLAKYGIPPNSKGVIRKLSKQAMPFLNVMAKDTPSSITQLMIQGVTIGISDMLKQLQQYRDADAEIAELGSRLLQMEQNSLNTLKSSLINV